MRGHEQGPGPRTAAEHGAPDRRLPLRRDLPALLLLLAVFGLELFSWWLCDGYQIADEVEYMEHAQAMVRGEQVIDSPTIRAFGFSAVLAPIFWIADRAGVEDFKPIVWLVRLVQMGLGLWLVRIAMRLGERLGGRGAGIAAGLVVGVNPVFLQYAVSPVSGLAAGVAVGMGLEALLDRGGARRGLRAGLWLGAGILMAYQSLIIAGPAVLAVLVRDRLRHPRHLLGIFSGLLLAVLAQVVFDRIAHGEWGSTLVRYFRENFAPMTAKWLYRLGIIELELARKIYDLARSDSEPAVADPSAMRSLLPANWYLVHLPQMVVWPLLVGGVAGIVRVLRRPSFAGVTLLAILVLNVVLMSQKGSKDFRLWLPLLPMIGALCGVGLAALAGGVDARGACSRRLAVVALCLCGAWLGVQQLVARNTRKFSGYWDAMELVCRLEGEQRGARAERREPRVASAYHWAVYLRQSPDVEIVKLPWQLDYWEDYDSARRMEDLVAISEMDWFVVHLPVLTNHPDLMRAVNAYYRVVACFWDHRDFEDIGPVFVLQRYRGGPSGRRFFEVVEGTDPAAYSAAHGLEDPVHFVRHLTLGDPATGATKEYRERIDFLGFEYEILAGDGHGWITYHWACRSEIFGDYTIVDRLTTPDERYAWQNNHPPAYGVHSTQTSREGGWQEGWIVRESWPVVAAADAYDWRAPFRPLGGDWRRGDLMPAALWMDLATFGPEDPADPANSARVTVTGRMEPARPGEDQPIRSGELGGVLRTSDGWCFSRDGMVRVGRFFLPVHPEVRVPDDGRPLPP